MKKIIAVFVAIVMLSVAFPVLAGKFIICPTCHGSGKCIRCSGRGLIWKMGWRQIRDKKGKIRNVLDNRYVSCPICHKTGKCSNCYGKKEIYLPTLDP